MRRPESYSFTRYLAAKASVDDRALNREVWAALAANLPESSQGDPLLVLEIGAGIGTMVQRMVDWGLLRYARYTAIDAEGENIKFARNRLSGWIRGRGIAFSDQPWPIRQDRQQSAFSNRADVVVELKAVDLFDFAAREMGVKQWDLVVTHAFLDLMDVPSALPAIFSLLKPGGLFYFTINFDGLTVLEPPVDPSFDALVIELYHRTMDERITGGVPSGDSLTGRHLFSHLKKAGGEILAAGSSDWLVYPRAGGYPNDEAYFLHFIIHTIHQALRGNPELEAGAFERWVAARHAQVERVELVYLAHQLDFLGTRN